MAILLALLGSNFLALLFSPAISANYYISAEAKSGGSGSLQSPWSSVGAALNSGKIRGGDQLLLTTGSYGHLRIKGAKFSSPVTISSKAGDTAHFTQINVRSSQNITFSNLNVWPNKPNNKTLVLVRTSRNSPDIIFQNLDVRASKDAANYRQWSKKLWRDRKVNGILAEGARNVIADSKLTATYFSASVTGRGGQITNNQILGFSGDGARALGDNSLIKGNTIQDCVKIDGNHDDGIMTWSLGSDKKPGGGTVNKLVIDGNLIEEWSGPNNHPFICDLQGMLLGGYLDDLVIQNNVVSASAYHGITAYGITRGLIANNTVVNSRGPSTTQPWIGTWGHKARGSRQVTLINNIAPKFSVKARPNIVPGRHGNVVLTHPDQQLMDPTNGDYRLKPGSKLINAGSGQFAPRYDIDGNDRTVGGQPDIGAYEAQ